MSRPSEVKLCGEAPLSCSIKVRRRGSPRGFKSSSRSSRIETGFQTGAVAGKGEHATVGRKGGHDVAYARVFGRPSQPSPFAGIHREQEYAQPSGRILRPIAHGQPTAVRRPGQTGSQRINERNPRLRQFPLPPAKRGNQVEAHFLSGFGTSAEKSDRAAVRRPDGAAIQVGMGGQSQRGPGPNHLDVNVEIIRIPPGPREGHLIAVGGKGTAALKARVTGERNRPHGFQGRFGCGQEVPQGRGGDHQNNHRGAASHGLADFFRWRRGRGRAVPGVVRSRSTPFGCSFCSSRRSTSTSSTC